MKRIEFHGIINNRFENIIKKYIKAYNEFDIDTMLSDIDENIIFENISQGSANMTLNGISELRKQAEESKQYFKEREQIITKMEFENDAVIIYIDYNAILAVDLPNGLKAGDPLKLQGKSIFKFNKNKIIKIKDIS